MRKTLCLLALCLFSNLIHAQSSQQERLKAHIYYLASDQLRGRRAGSDDARKAAEYLKSQYSAMGAKPWMEDYLIPFSPFGPVKGDSTSNYRNIAVLIPGSDDLLRNEYILIGAHYDHLGVKNGEVYNGADDNASGSAAVVEVARNLLARQQELKRSVVIVNFDAEEIGLVGSNALSHLLQEKELLKPCKLMMSIDMVGWLKASGHLTLEGCGTIRNGDQMIRHIAEIHGLPIHTKAFERSVLTATDTEPFATYRIPTLAVTTGLKSPYHKPGDDAELIDYEGLDKVVNFLTDLAVAASSDTEFRSSGKVAPKHGGSIAPVELGLDLAGGRNGLAFPSLALSTSYGWGWSGGASLLFNIGSKRMRPWFSLKVSGRYDSYWTPYPSEGDFWNGYEIYRQQSIAIPAEVRVTYGNASNSIHLGLGACYQHLLWSNFSESGLARTVVPDQWGWSWSLGMKLGKVEIGGTFTHGISDLMNPTRTRAISTRASLTYWIW